MNSNSNLQGRAPSEKPGTIIPVLLTPKEAARRLKLSNSWLSKARMRGDGPPYIRAGHAIRYAEEALPLIAEAESLLVLTKLARARMVRNGLMVALLAGCPIWLEKLRRLGNRTQYRQGRSDLVDCELVRRPKRQGQMRGAGLPH